MFGQGWGCIILKLCTDDLCSKTNTTKINKLMFKKGTPRLFRPLRPLANYPTCYWPGSGGGVGGVPRPSVTLLVSCCGDSLTVSSVRAHRASGPVGSSGPANHVLQDRNDSVAAGPHCGEMHGHNPERHTLAHSCRRHCCYCRPITLLLCRWISGITSPVLLTYIDPNGIGASVGYHACITRIK